MNDSGSLPGGNERDLRDLREVSDILSGLRADGYAREEAIKKLYRKYAGRFRFYCAKRRVSPADAEELAHEALIRIVYSFGGFRGEAAQFRLWIWTILRNVLFDFLQRRGEPVFEEADLPDVPSDAPTPEEVLDRQQTDRCVQQGWDRFATEHPDKALCLSWQASDGMSIVEIAALMGRTQKATKQYLYQCRQWLRRYIEHCSGGHKC